MTVTRRRVAERITTDAEPCACDRPPGRAPCGLHFSELPVNEKLAVWTRLGIGGHIVTYDDPARTRDIAHDRRYGG